MKDIQTEWVKIEGPLFYSEEIEGYAPLREAELTLVGCEGIAFRTKEVFWENQVLAVKFVLPESLSPHVVHAIARITKREFNKHSRYFYYEVQFVHMEPSDFTNLFNFISRQSSINRH